MLSCKDATRLMSEAQDRKLAVSEKMGLELHLMICKGCTNFGKQMDFLRQACRGYLSRQKQEEDAD